MFNKHPKGLINQKKYIFAGNINFINLIFFLYV